MVNSKVIRVYVNERLYTILKEYSRLHSIPMSDVTKLALVEYLERRNVQVNAK